MLIYTGKRLNGQKGLKKSLVVIIALIFRRFTWPC
jgi:hypothetical protein